MEMKLIMAVCFLPCILIVFGMLYMEGRQKGNVLLGVTLWPGAETEEGVKGIQRRFKKEMCLVLLISVLTFLCTCIPNRESIVFSAQMLWLMVMLVALFVPLARGNQSMKALKRERRIEILGRGQEKTPEPEGTQAEGAGAGQEAESEGNFGEKGYADRKAAVIPKEKPFYRLSLAGALCGLIPVIGELFFAPASFYGWWTELLLVTMFLVGLLCLWFQRSFWHMRTDVISCRSQVNIQLARARQYQWSRFWCMLLWGNTVFNVILWISMHWAEGSIYLILGGTLLYMLLALAGMLVAERNVRKAYGEYQREAGLSVEEDDHWIYGIFYYNKNDKRFMVNKRVGIGTTVNMAKTSGKVFTVGISVFTVAVLIWAIGLVLLEDFVPISLKVADNAVISSQYKEEYRIPLEEIETVELVTELPSMSKRVGTAMDTIRKGSFLAEGYMSCKVCVRIKEPPFVELTARDGMVYYLNDEEPEVTERVYEEILFFCQ